MVIRSFKFGTVGSPKSTPKKPGGSVGAVMRIKEMGMDALELGWVRSVRVSEKTCTAIKSTAKENEVNISVHAPYFINLNANPEEWVKSRKRLMDSAHYGFLSGANDIVFHPGSYFGNPPEQVLPIAIERLKDCIDELRENNNSVTLRPEVMGKAAMIGSLDDALLMSKEIDGVEPCMDFAHLHARTGDGSMNTYKEWMKVLEKYSQELGEDSLGRLHIHLSGIEYTPKGERSHLIFEESDLDLVGILKTLRDMHCRGTILCESPVLEEDALVIMETWDQISGEKP